MISRWRKDHGGSSAVFVAKDNLTNRVYAECFPDEPPTCHLANYMASICRLSHGG